MADIVLLLDVVEKALRPGLSALGVAILPALFEGDTQRFIIYPVEPTGLEEPRYRHADFGAPTQIALGLGTPGLTPAALSTDYDEVSAAGVAASTELAGDASVATVFVVRLTGRVVSGTFRLGYKARTSGPIKFDASAEEFYASVKSIFNPTNLESSPYTVERRDESSWAITVLENLILGTPATVAVATNGLVGAKGYQFLLNMQTAQAQTLLGSSAEVQLVLELQVTTGSSQTLLQAPVSFRRQLIAPSEPPPDVIVDYPVPENVAQNAPDNGNYRIRDGVFRLWNETRGVYERWGPTGASGFQSFAYLGDEP